jgi:hypothetical protein
MVFGLFKKKAQREPPKRFPPVPAWQPTERQPIDRLIERMKYYTDGKRDFAVFENGTIAILPDQLDDSGATSHAMSALHAVFHAHPDMRPLPMDDGNSLVRYNHDVVSVVLEDHVRQHWQVIDARHQDALATDEVLITPLGPNTFDDFGKKALFGRCFMFMDAQHPKVVRIVRRSV